MREINPTSALPSLEVCSREGAVQSRCECLRFEAEGVVFHSPIRFELMSNLLLNLHCDGQCGGDVAIEGVVIDCREVGPGHFETTVFFDLPASTAEKESAWLLPAQG